MFDYPCGQRLRRVLKREVRRLRRLGEVRCGDEVAEKLEQVWAKTIDRLLAKEKQLRGGIGVGIRGRNGCTMSVWPVKVASEWDTHEIGNLQINFGALRPVDTGQ
jgi:hypothetical protein